MMMMMMQNELAYNVNISHTWTS